MIYNPSGSKFTEDATINGTTYTVTNFTISKNGIPVPFQHSNGNYKGVTLKQAADAGTLAIECASATEPSPALGITFNYPAVSGSNWVIINTTETRTGTAAATYNLTLQNTTGSAT